MIGTTSIAVLYFRNDSPSEAHAYLSTGITDDLITHLARLESLNVVSRADVLPFRERHVDAGELGEALFVDYVVDGSVARENGHLRVGARLFEVSSGASLWEGRYEKSMDEAVKVVNEVLRGIARTLKVPVDSGGSRLVRAPKDAAAYEAYLRGRDSLSRRGRHNVEEALAAFAHAVSVDPTFAAAHQSMAEASIEMFTFYDGAAKWLDRAFDSSEKAAGLDAMLSEARFAQGIVHYHRGDFDLAKKALDSVVRGSSCCYEAYRWLGIISDMTGKFDAALAYYETAARVKPYSVEPWLYMNMTHRRKGDMDSALMSARRFLEVGIRKLEINPDDEVTLSRFAAIYTLLGEGQKARDALERILKWDPDDGTVLYNCACTYALLGDHEQALRCLRMALEHGYRNVREWVRSDPDFDVLRQTDAFRDLLNQFDASL